MLAPSRILVVVLIVASGFWTVSVTAPASAQSALVLTPDGLEPVRIGMTIPAAQKKLKAKLRRIARASAGFSKGRESSENCWLWRRRDEIDPGIIYMTEKRVIVRIDIFVPRSGVAPAVKTRAGVGIGSSEAEFKARYGDGLVLEPQPSNPGVKWGVAERSGQAGLRIEVLDGKVTSIFAGRGPALDYPEAYS